MRNAPWQDIVAVQEVSSYEATVDGYFLQDRMFTLLKAGSLLKSLVAAIVGTNAQEGAYFFLLSESTRQLTQAQAMVVLGQGFPNYAQSLYNRYLPTAVNPPNNTVPVSTPSLLLSHVDTDGVFLCPSRYAAHLLSKRIPTYRYLFSMTSTCSFVESDLLPLLGAFHGSELPYVFDQPPSLTCSRPQSQLDLTYRMVEYWTNFSKGKEPGTLRGNGIQTWLQVQSGQVAHLDLQDEMLPDADREICSFWAKILKL